MSGWVRAIPDDYADAALRQMKRLTGNYISSRANVRMADDAHTTKALSWCLGPAFRAVYRQYGMYGPPPHCKRKMGMTL
jgi:hypothetical protein